MTPRAVKRNISLRYCTKQLQPEDPKRSAQAKAKASPPAAPVQWASRAAAGALGPAGTQGGPEVMMQGFESAEVEVESLTRGALSWCGMRGSMHAPRVGCLARERAASSCREGAACFKAPHLPLLDRVVSDRVDARQQLHHNRVHLLARLAAVYRSMGGEGGESVGQSALQSRMQTGHSAARQSAPEGVSLSDPPAGERRAQVLLEDRVQPPRAATAAALAR